MASRLEGGWPTVNTSSVRVPRRQIAVVEVCALVVVYGVGLWWLGPLLGAHRWLDVCYTIGVVVVAVYFGVVSSVYIHRDLLSERGLGRSHTGFIRVDNFRVALVRFAVPTVLGATVILGLVLVRRPQQFIQLDWGVAVLKFSLYVLSALAQGLLTLAWLLPRLRDIVPRLGDTQRHRLTVSLGLATVFASAHLPNVPMMTMTFAWGLVAGWLYQRTPNLCAAALCHALLGTLVHRVLEFPMRIGPFYWDPDRYIVRTLLPFIRDWINGRF